MLTVQVSTQQHFHLLSYIHGTPEYQSDIEIKLISPHCIVPLNYGRRGEDGSRAAFRAEGGTYTVYKKLDFT